MLGSQQVPPSPHSPDPTPPPSSQSASPFVVHGSGVQRPPSQVAVIPQSPSPLHVVPGSLPTVTPAIAYGVPSRQSFPGSSGTLAHAPGFVPGVRSLATPIP